MSSRLVRRSAWHGQLLFACALLRCTVEYPLERRAETTAPVSLEEACLKLGRLLSSSAGGQAAQESNFAPGGDERWLAYGQYCQPAQAAPTGWENCAEPGGRSSPSCSGPVLPYLICLADPELVPVSECVPLAPTCAPAEVAPQVLDAAQACEIGIGFDGRNSTVFAYTLQAMNCSDGNSYGFTCEPPDAACISSCACSRDAALSARIGFDVSTEFSDQAIWDACGLPALVASSR